MQRASTDFNRPVQENIVNYRITGEFDMLYVSPINCFASQNSSIVIVAVIR